ncbi:selenium metabolism-associated LysR family transcriptional regulator [Miniphocaeibacter halophilus]|uniref:LysR family transcriptional regulator n=1 Tax=Miniphocaeibacter halophilus TaxID=2931922 RepID=A0AC61MRM3_9FIRM|nr:selenium metabolism-associated LysR family transcriptional regulator [Miniphocaeibacter halophilus]QQK08200.1 LysR family transcriptional regulator [Miniphocaeibacter halophilus]
MEFRQLEIFVSLVENESFSLTAVEMNISQPTVSLQLKQLEEELDTALFIRSTRELKLTDTGQKLYEEAKELISRRDRVIDRFSERKQKKLAIGVSTISGSYILPNILKEYCSKFPNILIDVKETNSAVTIKKVSDYQVDFGIVGMKKENENCEFYPIYEDEFVYICPNTEYYRKLKESNPSISQLAKEPLIIREYGSGIKNNMDRLLATENINVDKLNIVISINDEEIIKKLVSLGLGTSFISKVAVESLEKKGDLITIPLTNYPERFRSLYAVWNKKVNLASHVKDFLNIVIKK